MLGRTDVPVRPHLAQHPASAHSGEAEKGQVRCRAAPVMGSQPHKQRVSAWPVHPMGEMQREEGIVFLETHAAGQKSSSPQKTMLARG